MTSPSRTAEEAKANSIIRLAEESVEKLSGSVVDEVYKTTEVLGRLAEKGTIRFLLAFGGTIIVFAALFKLQFGTHHLANLTSTEFGLMIGFGTALMIAGVVFDLYTYHREMNAFEENARTEQARKKFTAEIAKSGIDAIATMSGTLSGVVQKALEQPEDKGQSPEMPRR